VLDAVEAGIMALSMLFAVGCFSRVLTTQGRDVELVKGISCERGLAKLFALKGVQKGVREPAAMPVHMPSLLRCLPGCLACTAASSASPM
jgi:hypothetical protein